MQIEALVVGATGVAGRGASQELLDAGARVHGVSRHREGIVPGVQYVAADLLDPANVAKSLPDLNITYPVAIDSNYAIWKAFHNEYWPAHYFIDANGNIRHHHFGEGEYDKSEEIIQQLLKEKNSNLQVSGICLPWSLKLKELYQSILE